MGVVGVKPKPRALVVLEECASMMVPLRFSGVHHEAGKVVVVIHADGLEEGV